MASNIINCPNQLTVIMDLISSSKTEVLSSLVTEDSPPEITPFRGPTSPPSGDYNNSLVLITLIN